MDYLSHQGTSSAAGAGGGFVTGRDDILYKHSRDTYTNKKEVLIYKEIERRVKEDHESDSRQMTQQWRRKRQEMKQACGVAGSTLKKS